MSLTIKDVARLADCSIKTVSRVLNDEPNVTEETRGKVVAAIRASGYSPNLAARQLVQKRSNTICILVYPGFLQPSSAWLTRLLDLTYEDNYELLLQAYYPSFPQSRRKLADLVTSKRFDGYISTPPCEADGFVVDLLKTYKTPLVQINPLDVETSEEVTQWVVNSEDKRGANLATAHLIELGHKKIAFLRGPRNMRAAFDRLGGFYQTMNDNGLEVCEDYLQNSEFTFDGGYTAAKILLKIADPPTAIYAANDEVAQGVLFAANEMGLIVPRDLSICGHDDLISSSRTWPGITTVHQPVEELLERAIRVLIAILKQEEVPISPVLLEPKLIIRGSTVTPRN